MNDTFRLDRAVREFDSDPWRIFGYQPTSDHQYWLKPPGFMMIIQRASELLTALLPRY